MSAKKTIDQADLSLRVGENHAAVHTGEDGRELGVLPLHRRFAFLPQGDVDVGAGNTPRPSVGVMLGHAAAGENPAEIAITGPETVFALV
jgi:hypothetical protein